MRSFTPIHHSIEERKFDNLSMNYQNLSIAENWGDVESSKFLRGIILLSLSKIWVVKCKDISQKVDIAITAK